jgi:hypothetical protein
LHTPGSCYVLPERKLKATFDGQADKISAIRKLKGPENHRFSPEQGTGAGLIRYRRKIILYQSVFDLIYSRNILAACYQRAFTFSSRTPVEIHSVVHFCYLQKLSRDDCFTQINEAHRPATISLSTGRWHAAFASGKTKLDDDSQPGRPVNESISMCLQRILLDEPLAFTRDIAEKLEEPRASVLKCLIEGHGLQKMKFRRPPRAMSQKSSGDRVILGKDLLQPMESGEQK